MTTAGPTDVPILPELGELVAGRYRVERRLGAGGCGVVYEAFDIRFDREVALKVLSPDAIKRVSNLRARFVREIDLVKRLEHPNVVRLYDFCDAERDDLLWMSMELVRGRELRDALEEHGRLDPRRTRHIVLQILAGLAAAHTQHIVHRDLKPNNVMLTDVGVDRDMVKILDFGIGKALNNPAVQDITSTTDSTLGTPRYMAPEVLLKEGSGPHSDVYAVGLMMLELLTGFAAVDGEDLYEVVARQLTGEIRIPRWLLDTEMGPVVRAAVAKDPQARFASASEFHAALERVQITPSLMAAFHEGADYVPGTSDDLDTVAATPSANPTGPSSRPAPETGPSDGAGSTPAASSPRLEALLERDTGSAFDPVPEFEDDPHPLEFEVEVVDDLEPTGDRDRPWGVLLVAMLVAAAVGALLVLSLGTDDDEPAATPADGSAATAPTGPSEAARPATSAGEGQAPSSQNGDETGDDGAQTDPVTTNQGAADPAHAAADPTPHDAESGDGDGEAGDGEAGDGEAEAGAATPADAADAADAAASDAGEPAAEMAELELVSEPSRASVSIDGREICEDTPCTVTLERDVFPATLKFRRRGYRSRSRDIEWDDDRRVRVELERRKPRDESTSGSGGGGGFEVKTD